GWRVGDRSEQVLLHGEQPDRSQSRQAGRDPGEPRRPARRDYAVHIGRSHSGPEQASKYSMSAPCPDGIEIGPRSASRILPSAATKSLSAATSSSSWLCPRARRPCPWSSRSREWPASACASASAARTTLSSTNLRPPTSRESRISIASSGLCSLKLEPDVHEVVRRPGAGVPERELVEATGNRLDPGRERALLVARYEERRVHDHVVADRLGVAPTQRG